MIRALDLFPFEPAPSERLPIQGRILLRRHQVRLFPQDIRDFAAAGMFPATDCPDAAQRIGAQGF